MDTVALCFLFSSVYVNNFQTYFVIINYFKINLTEHAKQQDNSSMRILGYINIIKFNEMFKYIHNF